MTTASHGIAMPHGNAAEGAEDAPTVPAGTGVRARLADIAMTQRAGDFVSRARDDAAESWLVTGHPPSLGELWATRHQVDDVPGAHWLLKGLRVAFNYFRVVWSGALYGLAWAGQEPARALAGLAVLGVLAALVSAITALI